MLEYRVTARRIDSHESGTEAKGCASWSTRTKATSGSTLCTATCACTAPSRTLWPRLRSSSARSGERNEPCPRAGPRPCRAGRVGALVVLPDVPAIRLGVLLVLLAPCASQYITFAHLRGRGHAAGAIAVAPVNPLVQLMRLPLYPWLFKGRSYVNGGLAMEARKPDHSALRSTFSWRQSSHGHDRQPTGQEFPALNASRICFSVSISAKKTTPMAMITSPSSSGTACVPKML